MRLTERINEAFNSPPKEINKFEDAELLATDRPIYCARTLVLMGRGEVRRLPYGAGKIAKVNGTVVSVSSCGDEWHAEWRERFRYVKFPLTINFMD